MALAAIQFFTGTAADMYPADGDSKWPGGVLGDIEESLAADQPDPPQGVKSTATCAPEFSSADDPSGNTCTSGRTSFVVAHRLSTITRANPILVLEHGRLVERGTHAELLARDGAYSPDPPETRQAARA